MGNILFDRKAIKQWRLSGVKYIFLIQEKFALFIYFFHFSIYSLKYTLANWFGTRGACPVYTASEAGVVDRSRLRKSL